jgi:hypothetical protein
MPYAPSGGQLPETVEMGLAVDPAQLAPPGAVAPDPGIERHAAELTAVIDVAGVGADDVD